MLEFLKHAKNDSSGGWGRSYTWWAPDSTLKKLYKKNAVLHLLWFVVKSTLNFRKIKLLLKLLSKQRIIAYYWQKKVFGIKEVENYVEGTELKMKQT